jgi:uncharacterized membrane protein YjfL (UPF0719 family)
MFLDGILTGLVMLAGFYVLFVLGKFVNDLLHREYRLDHELVEKDNPALALAVVGYYFGLVLAIGGALVGPSRGLVKDLIDLGIYGASAIVLLNVSWYVCAKLILFKFKLSDELIRDQNIGSGAVSAGVSIASGFIIFGAVQGEGGGILSMLVFWAVGQVVLVLAGLVYEWIAPYDVHQQIEKDNVAAGVSFGGALTAVGVVVGLSASTDFVSWSDSLIEYLVYAAIGLILLPVVRFLTDWLLLPGVTLTDEIANQEKPNLGAAYIEAFAYVAAAFAIHWCV